MNANRYYDAKVALLEELGDKYPMNKKELTAGFLKKFAAYLDHPNEDDYDGFEEWEDAYYNSEMWHFFCHMADAKVSENKQDWADFIDWVTENYFPEYIIFSDDKPGIIHAHTEDLPFFDKTLGTKVISKKIEGGDSVIWIAEAICQMIFSECPVDFTLDATYYLSSVEKLLALSFNLNLNVCEDGTGWKVRNGEMFFCRTPKPDWMCTNKVTG